MTSVPLVRKVMLVPLVLRVFKVNKASQARKARRVMLVPRVLREKLVLRALRGWSGVARGVLNQRTRSVMW